MTNKNAKAPGPSLKDTLSGAPHRYVTAVEGVAIHDLIKLPSLRLDCPECKRDEPFDGRWAHVQPRLSPSGHSLGIDPRHVQERNALIISNARQVAIYSCRTCRSHVLNIPLQIEWDPKLSTATVTKIGQFPRYAPRIPARAQQFFSPPELALYRKGWECEHEGFGIGAFVYYRRVVEDVWAKLLDRLIEAAEHASETTTHASLVAAKGNWQFRNAVETAMPAVPAHVMIGTRNPLKVLHGVFSDGLHNRTDADCLQQATDGRQVLEEMLKRVHEVLQDNRHVTEAIERLSKRPKPLSES